MAKNKDISDYSLAEMNENSNLIRLYTEKTIIWRGEEFATFNVDVELSEELALQNEGCTLSVALLKESTKEVIYPKDSNHLNMHFLQHGSANKPWEGMFDKSYLKDTVYIHIHKDLFADGDKFNVIAFTKEEHVIIPRVVKKKKEGKIIFGASESISVTNYSLAIADHFEESNRVFEVEDGVVVYYNKLPSDFNGLIANISVLNEDGNPSALSIADDVSLKPELVYENGFPVSIMPIKPLKTRKTVRSKFRYERSTKPILFSIDGDPVLASGTTSTKYKFNLEEVTYHHHGHGSYKLRISIDHKKHGIVVHPCIMNSVIVVLSKPKTGDKAEREAVKLEGGNSMKRRSESRKPPRKKGRKAGSTDKTIEEPMSSSNLQKTNRFKSPNAVKVLRSLKQLPNDMDHDKFASFPSSIGVDHLLNAYIVKGTCIQCNVPVSRKTILKTHCHQKSCNFVSSILPAFQDINAIIPIETASCFATGLAESQSFEEESRKFIAESPCEMFDANVFDDAPLFSKSCTFQGRGKHILCPPSAKTCNMLEDSNDIDEGKPLQLVQENLNISSMKKKFSCTKTLFSSEKKLPALMKLSRNDVDGDNNSDVFKGNCIGVASTVDENNDFLSFLDNDGGPPRFQGKRLDYIPKELSKGWGGDFSI